jgi:hypothetical protein
MIKMRMRQYIWNNVIWDAMSELKFVFRFNSKSDYFIIDNIFSHCEKKLSLLGAPEREINLRFFALALHCDKNYPRAFFESTIFARFSSSLDFSHFKQVVEMLIEEGSFALVVYWVVLRCSLASNLPSRVYSALETEIMQTLLA